MNVVLTIFEDCHANDHGSCRRQYQDNEGGVNTLFVCVCEKCHG